MSNDQPRAPQRYSRYTRPEVMPAQQPAEPSLEEITSRTLQGARPAPTRLTREAELYDDQPVAQPVMAEWLSPEPRFAPPLPPIDVEVETVIEHAPLPRTPQAEAGPAHSVAYHHPAPVAETPEYMVAPHHPAPVAETLEPKATRKPVPSMSNQLQQGQKAAVRVANVVRDKAGPVVTKSALWLPPNFRRREVRKRYGEALVFTHNKVLDRRLEKLFFVPTLKTAVTNPAPERGILYDGPVPSAVFTWALAAMPQDLREYAFIDFRAGRGRTVLLAAKRDFERIIGFEYDAELFDDLQMNIAQYPRSEMVCRNIDCYRGDLDGIRIPDQPSVLYFSNAWREDMLSGVMDYVRQTYRDSPRRMYVMLENADETVALPKDGIFHRFEPGISERTKLKLLSPMEFQFYRTAD
jgi:hypothetical protein